MPLKETIEKTLTADADDAPSPGGMGAVPQDCVEYAIYPCETGEDLGVLRRKILAFAEEWVGAYVWHSECFALQEETDPLPHLHGRSHFGDCVEDEWYTVAILVAVSVRFPMVAVRCVDSYGQFLLIEAADVLPEWMDPDTMDNRIFIRRGKILSIPPVPLNPGQCFPLLSGAGQPAAPHNKLLKHLLCPPLGLIAAVDAVSRSNACEFLERKVQKIVEQRIAGYPSKCIAEQSHVVKLHLPTPVAIALQMSPQLVPPAVNALCERDIENLRHSKVMKAFSPRKVGSTTAMVRFTKITYAMLTQLQFHPPGAHFDLPEPSDPDYRSHTTGAKLACGYEAAYQTGLATKGFDELVSFYKVVQQSTDDQQAGQQVNTHQVDRRSSAVTKETKSQDVNIKKGSEGKREETKVKEGEGEKKEGEGEKEVPRPSNPNLASATAAFDAELERTRQSRKAVRPEGDQGGEAEAMDIEKVPKWIAYCERLKKRGYFGDEIEGSKLYKEKREQAKKYFVEKFGGTIVEQADGPANGGAAVTEAKSVAKEEETTEKPEEKVEEKVEE
eukprot:Sspe_Gene.56269::Locus_30970_Transcript_1_1_Confidence_1.000_Length_1766::g.56269::m.56269